jgi:hypothetical protein
MEFKKFNKIPRLKRDIIITEKIDGTNAQVYILHVNTNTNMKNDFESRGWRVIKNGDFSYGIVPGSRNKLITPKKDNFGFAKWVLNNADELIKLGPGRHYGEWWGAGIQRNYDLKTKVFSLFNTSRWIDPNGFVHCPEICEVVPVLYKGPWDQDMIDDSLNWLRTDGSVAAPGFYDPEGIVIYHPASNSLFKITLENDELPKGLIND